MQLSGKLNAGLMSLSAWRLDETAMVSPDDPPPATIKSIPYQTLIRQWLADGIRKELHLISK